MTKKPPGRPSEPHTGPAAPAPAHGDGPTGPSAPTGHTEPRGCPFGFRHYNCDCEPLEATMPEPADPLSGDLRKRLADALRDDTYPYGREEVRGEPAEVADAVLPVVEAALSDRYRALDAQLTRERRGRLAAEAAVRRAQALADRWSAALGVDIAHARALREALDAEQPKETP